MLLEDLLDTSDVVANIVIDEIYYIKCANEISYCTVRTRLGLRELGFLV